MGIHEKFKCLSVISNIYVSISRSKKSLNFIYLRDRRKLMQTEFIQRVVFLLFRFWKGFKDVQVFRLAQKGSYDLYGCWTCYTQRTLNLSFHARWEGNKGCHYKLNLAFFFYSLLCRTLLNAVDFSSFLICEWSELKSFQHESSFGNTYSEVLPIIGCRNRGLCWWF